MNLDDPKRPEFSSWKSYRRFERKVRRSTRFVWDTEIQAFLDTVVATIKNRDYMLGTDYVLYRAQLGADRDPTDIDAETEAFEPVYPFPQERMKPLPGKAFEGRANPAGIPILYTANSLETAISEVRPWIGSEVSVARCRPVRSLKVLNLSVNHGDAPFAGVNFDHVMSGTEPPPSEKCNAVWAEIENAFSTPVSRSSDSAEYAPTQILAELFRSIGYEGIAYKSNLNRNHGLNISIFDLDLVQIIERKVYITNGLKIDFEELITHDETSKISDLNKTILLENKYIHDSDLKFKDFPDFFSNCLILGEFLNSEVDYKRENRSTAYVKYSIALSCITFCIHLIKVFPFDVGTITGLIKNDYELTDEEKDSLSDYLSICLRTEPVDFLIRQKLKSLSEEKIELIYKSLLRFIVFAKDKSGHKNINIEKCFIFFPDRWRYTPLDYEQISVEPKMQFPSDESEGRKQVIHSESRIQQLRQKLFGSDTSIFHQRNASKVAEIVGRISKKPSLRHVEYENAVCHSHPSHELGEPRAKPATLDAARIAAIRHDTARVSAVLGGIFSADDDASNVFQPDFALRSPLAGLDPKHASLVEQIIQRKHWTVEEFYEVARRQGLMPSGAIEIINEWAFGKFDEPLLDECDGYDLCPDIVDALRTEIAKRQ